MTTSAQDQTRLTPWGRIPAHWEMKPWKSFATRSGTPVVVSPDTDLTQVTVRVRHRGVVPRPLVPHRPRRVRTPNQNLVSAGQFIISKIDARNGACGFIPPELDGAIVSNDFPVYEIHSPMNPRYLHHIADLPRFWRLCETVSDGTTNRVRLDLRLFDDLEFPIPPAREQKSISSVLDAVDYALAEAHHVQRSTDRLRRSVLHTLSAHGTNGSALPAEWTVVPLRRVATIGAGDPAPQDPRDFSHGQHPFVRTADVGRVKHSAAFFGTRDRLTDDAVRHRRLHQWPSGTILIPKSGASTALNNRVRLAEPAYVSSHLATVRARNGTDEAFLYHALCSLDARTLMGNTGYPSLSLEDLRSAPIPLPPFSEQTRIARLLDSIDRTLSAVGKVVSATAMLRNALHNDPLVRGIPRTTALGATLR